MLLVKAQLEAGRVSAILLLASWTTVVCPCLPLAQSGRDAGCMYGATFQLRSRWNECRVMLLTSMKIFFIHACLAENLAHSI